MADVTVAQFADVLKVSVEKLITQLDEAGITVASSDDTISEDAKLELLGKQTERVNLVFTLLEIMSGDDNIKPYYEQFKPVVIIFEENPKITEKELAQIGSLMETVRKNILK